MRGYVDGVDGAGSAVSGILLFRRNFLVNCFARSAQVVFSSEGDMLALDARLRSAPGACTTVAATSAFSGSSTVAAATETPMTATSEVGMTVERARLRRRGKNPPIARDMLCFGAMVCMCVTWWSSS